MGTAKKNWGSAVEADSSQLLDGTTEYYSSDVDLETNGYEGCIIEIVATFPSGADENVNINVYPSLDNTYDGQEVSIFSTQIELVDNDAVYFSFIVKDLTHFRIGYNHDASTSYDATITSVNTRGWNWEIV